MKPTDLNSNTYIDIAVENNNKDHKFEIGDYAPYTSSKGKIKVKLGLSNYATKFNSKSGTAANTSKFAKKFDLARN